MFKTPQKIKEYSKKKPYNDEEISDLILDEFIEIIEVIGVIEKKVEARYERNIRFIDRT